jgi:hypothetical protein
VAKACGANYRTSLGTHVEIFEHVEKSLRRSDTSTKVPQMPETQEVIIKVVAEVPSALEIATMVSGQGATIELITDDGRLLLASPC